MTATQYRRALKTIGLSIVGAAKVIGVKRRQSQRYAHGHAVVPPAVAKLLRLAIKLNVTADELKEL